MARRVICTENVTLTEQPGGNVAIVSAEMSDGIIYQGYGWSESEAHMNLVKHVTRTYGYYVAIPEAR